MRKVPRSIYESSRNVARKLRGTSDYEFMRYERKKVEMSFAHLKAILKLDRLRLRGLAALMMSSFSPLQPKTSGKWQNFT